MSIFISQRQFITVTIVFMRFNHFKHSLTDLWPLTVHPDPPVALNWTLLNVSRSGLNYDIMASWEPPPSADVSVGWLTLVYELQFRRRNSSHWKVVSHT
jgi:hypothetical protein